MMNEPHIQDERDRADEAILEIRTRLSEYNVRHSTIAESGSLVFTVRDDQLQLLGGIAGRLWGECLEISFFWVAEALRGAGIGGALLTKIEHTAKERGGRRVLLDTFSFQAPQFYLNRGYTLQFEMPGYSGASRYWLTKELD